MRPRKKMIGLEPVWAEIEVWVERERAERSNQTEMRERH